jgi:hypothetical protein
MAGAFALALLASAAMRAFLVDYDRAEDAAREQEFASLNARHNALLGAVTTARATLQTASGHLALTVAQAIDEIERALLAGEIMILASRSARSDTPASTAAITAGASTGGDPSTISTATWHLSLTTSQPDSA